MIDYRNVLGNKPRSVPAYVYPRPDHFVRAHAAGWMRPFDLAEFEAHSSAQAESS